LVDDYLLPLGVCENPERVLVGQIFDSSVNLQALDHPKKQIGKKNTGKLQGAIANYFFQILMGNFGT